MVICNFSRVGVLEVQVRVVAGQTIGLVRTCAWSPPADVLVLVGCFWWGLFQSDGDEKMSMLMLIWLWTSASSIVHIFLKHLISHSNHCWTWVAGIFRPGGSSEGNALSHFVALIAPLEISRGSVCAVWISVSNRMIRQQINNNALLAACEILWYRVHSSSKSCLRTPVRKELF